MLSLFVVALVVGSARCAIPTIDYFTICDDIQHVYAAHSLGVDEIGTLNKWNTTLHVKIPTTTKVLAISCKNKGGPAGLLGSTNDGRILTNSTWKCSNTLESDWNTVNFNDSSWPDAVQVDTNVAPGPVHHGWKVQDQIDPTAVWISTQEKNIPAGTTSYCRLKLVFEFLMICDDNSTLYVDGLRVGEQGAGAQGYKYVSNPMEIPRLATTFAISCENAGGFTAFMGASKSGDLVTDAKWKVKRLAMRKSDTVRIPEPIGWTEPEFDDSTWQNALLIVDNKNRKPTYQSWIPTIKTQIDSNAWWIGAVPQPIETGPVDKKDKSVLLIRRKLSCMWTQTC